MEKHKEEPERPAEVSLASPSTSSAVGLQTHRAVITQAEERESVAGWMGLGWGDAGRSGVWLLLLVVTGGQAR